jgi:hypothetical protein
MVITAVRLVPIACSMISHDEFECEQAVSHLVECCPGFNSERLTCSDSGGCGEQGDPALPVDEASCIQKHDCASLVASGLCARAQDAVAYVKIDDESVPQSVHVQVCP